MTPVDVLVVGAGPAGLYAAQLLARRRLAVRVLEEHDRVGEPVHCTGILGAEAFDLPGVDREAVLGMPSTARFHSPGGYWLDYTGSTGEVIVIDRGAFDRTLARAAVAAGAEVLTDARALRVRADGAGVAVDARVGGEPRVLTARMCLLACGARYGLQRALGLGGPRCFLSAAQTEVAAAAITSLQLFFRRDTAPRGFAWLVPIIRDGRARAKVGVMVASRPRHVLGAVLRELAAAGWVRVGDEPAVVRLLPLAPLARTFADRVLAIGDAAGLVKPTTGGGIYYGLLSARWASEVTTIAFRRGDFSAAVLRGYEEAWRTHLGPELSVGLWFRRLAEWLTPGDLDALTRLAHSDEILTLVRATARFNRHRDLIREVIRHPGVHRIIARRLLGATAP